MATNSSDDHAERPLEPHPLTQARLAIGLSRAQLAERAGISRQALAAIEAGHYQPGVAAALAIARALGRSVETLFGGRDFDRVVADVAPRGASRTAPLRPGTRVVLARVGRHVVAVRAPRAALDLTPPGGIVESARGRRAMVQALRTPQEIDTTLLIAGCDPGVVMLADYLARAHAPARVVAFPSNSSAALEALARGQAHAAGIHLRDSASGEYNLAAARKALKGRHAVLVNFARWEIGIATAPGNPKGLAAVADFARPDVAIVNRERGAGARATLDEALARLDLAPARVAGYAHEVPGHLEVAAAIAAGDADAGLTIRIAAEAYGLGFIALAEERYDLVITEASRPVNAMLEALVAGRFARELAATCGYDTSKTGQAMGRLG